MFFVFKLLSLLIVLFINIVELKKDDYCFNLDPIKPQIKQFASKTSYQFVRGNLTKYINIPGCIPTKFWIINRHGTRLPTANGIKKMTNLSAFRDEIINNYKENKPSKGALCNQDLELLRNWKWDNNITEDHDEFLVNQGWNDLKWLAQAYQKSFPSLLPRNYSNTKFLFRHTKTQRTEASYKAFVDGLFGENSYKIIPSPPIPEIDTLLKPQDNCPAWIENNDRVDGPDSEIELFLNSDIYNKTIKEVSKRLGFKNPVKAEQIKQIFEICRYEQAWNINDISAWCAILLRKHVIALEYSEDLKYYYKTGYGSSINYKITCEIIADLIKRLDDKSDKSPIAIVYFTHSVTMHMLFVALGAFHDTVELKSNNFKNMNHRKWKSSEFGPFATNLAAIKYDCPLENEREKVLFLYNEKPLQLDWCNKGVCNWSDVKKNYKHFTNNVCSNIFCNGNISGPNN